MRTRLGRVEVTGGFLLLTAWLNYLDRQGVVPLALLACALHELGHWAALRALGVRVRRVRLTAVGAEMEVDRGLSYGGELLAALAGEPHLLPRQKQAVLTTPYDKSSPRRRFLRGIYLDDEVTLPQGHSSGQLASLVGCSCLVELPEGSPPAEAGQTVQVWLL